ncbi:MAG: hypothetical protein GWQ05_11570, partial [Verrucomicrobiaceae bacterium]|nr:hypothetical protein [Verrucomicrobiaceae bacterium]
RVPSPESRVPSPESRVPSPESRVPSPESQSAVFVAHGLNANRENFMEPVRLLHDLRHSVLIIDFPAHGDSPGRATTIVLQEAADVKAAHS